jgi:hypothetical protein
MTIKYFKDYIESINEGLIKTYPGNIVAKNLENILLGLNLKFNVEYLNDFNKIKLTFYFFNSIPIQNLDDLFDVINSSVINRGGWFPSQMNITNIHGMENKLKYNMEDLFLNHRVYNKVEIIYDSKFDEDILDIPKKLYHLSIGEYKNKILKFGLSSKSKNKLSSHLDRIYLCLNIEDCKYLITRMKLYYSEEKSFNIYNKENKKYEKNSKPIIFEIDNSDSFIKKLYKDPNYENGFYTLENIKPDKISIVEF